ncbi:hypothetical protein JCM10295v2_002051 [Rhodotorula toruloides]
MGVRCEWIEATRENSGIFVRLHGYQQDRLDIAMFERMHNPEIAMLGRQYLYYNPPLARPAPPPLTFDPSIDMRRLGRPKTEQDKHERALCRQGSEEGRGPREGEEAARRDGGEWRSKRSRRRRLDGIVELSEEIAELKIKTELRWLAIEAEAGGDGLSENNA